MLSFSCMEIVRKYVSNEETVCMVSVALLFVSTPQELLLVVALEETKK